MNKYPMCVKCNKTMVVVTSFVKACDPPIHCDLYKCFGCGHTATEEAQTESAEHQWHQINP